MCTVHLCARAHLLQDPSLKTATVQARSPGTRINVAEHRAGIFKQSMGARNRVGIGLSYRPELEFLKTLWGLGTD
jgi:hypothetical protein